MAISVFPAQRRAAAIASLLAPLLLSACSDRNGKARADAEKAAPPVPVVVASAAVATVPYQLTAVGTVQPNISVAVKARVDGLVEKVHFREGEAVRAGQRLFSLDPRPLRAELAEAEANLARNRALLANARRQSARYADLRERNFVSQEAYNQIRTEEDTAGASVRADQAAAERARVQLAYASIASPIAGVAGRVLVQEGNMVRANDTDPMVVINQVSPIRVAFALPEQHLEALRQALARGPVDVQVAPQPGAGRPAQGRLDFVDNTVDPSTGMIGLRASFANRDHALWPGQFVNATVLLGEQADALVVPAQAVQNGPEGAFVFVVRPDATVELRPVQAERTVAGQTVIGKGLRAGETVVVDGHSRLAPGARVKAQDKPAAAP
jgi:multidrug efflux system membrane fusion protein